MIQKSLRNSGRLLKDAALCGAVCLFLLTGLAVAQEPRAYSDFGAMGTAKVLCSAVFVSGRELDEALRNSAFGFISGEDWKLLQSRSSAGSEASIELDQDARQVSVTLRGFTGRAKYFGDQGCVILPFEDDRVFFEPVEVRSTLPDPASHPWPMGDLLPQMPLPESVDAIKVRQAVDAAFAGNGLTAAFVVVHKGRIIAERYGQGATKETQLESWSMGKSLTAALLGILVQEGHFGLQDPAPVELWHQDPADPRAKINISDLLRMSSGLLFSHASQPRYEWGRAIADHLYIYAGGIDAFHFSITRPVEFPPNEVGRYRNCDPLTVGYIIRQTVEKMGENYLTWPQKALFDHIGIRKQVLEPDPYGNFLLTGYDYGTGRNWARLGLLYLQDGMWQGERILPEGWSKFVGTPAPAWERPRYGGLFWVNGDGRWKVPKDAYYMSGAGGQHVIIIPSHDLVVVRMGHRRGQRSGQQSLNNALEMLMKGVGP
jgi:CubicO group peptidase (beta-lactamase class C family)